MGFKSIDAIDPALLMALSESVESATLAVAHGDLQKLELEIGRQWTLLSRTRAACAMEGIEVTGDGGDGACARDQHELCVVLAHQITVLGRAVSRGLRTVTALRSLQPSADGTYSPLVSERRT